MSYTRRLFRPRRIPSLEVLHCSSSSNTNNFPILCWTSLRELKQKHKTAFSPKISGVRHFATNTSKSSAKRRRKARSLAAPDSPKTTRERIRWLQNHNQILHDNHYRHKEIDRRIEDVGEATEERLNWMRNKIYGFWRGGEESPKSARPPRIGLKMDAKWWAWNIVFALLPAFVIAVYCEFIGKPKMFEFNRQMHIREQKKRLGDDYKEEEDQALVRMMEQSKPLSEKLYDAVYDLTFYFLGQGVPPVDPTTTKDGASQRTPQSELSDKQAVKNDEQNAGDSKDMDDAEAIAALKQRLEALEKRLQERKQATQPESTPNQTGASSGSSRIHDRVVAQRTEERRVREKDAAAANEKKEEESTSLWNSLAQKKEALMEYWRGPSDEHIVDASKQKHDSLKGKDRKQGSSPIIETSSRGKASYNAGSSAKLDKDGDNAISSQARPDSEVASSKEEGSRSATNKLKSSFVKWWKSIIPSQQHSEGDRRKAEPRSDTSN